MRTVFHLIAEDEVGIEPVMQGGTQSDAVESLLEEGVSLRACANTLDTKDLDESDLVAGVETVPSDAGELTRLQDDDYAYIRPQDHLTLYRGHLRD